MPRNAYDPFNRSSAQPAPTTVPARPPATPPIQPVAQGSVFGTPYRGAGAVFPNNPARLPTGGPSTGPFIPAGYGSSVFDVQPVPSNPFPPAPPTTGGPLPPTQFPTPAPMPGEPAPTPDPYAGSSVGGALGVPGSTGPGLPGQPAPGQIPGPNGEGGFGPGNIVTDYMSQLLDPNGTYISNARRRGIEQANSRGMLNSNMAAGASQRSAIEAAQPLLDQAMNLHRQRESNAFDGEQSALGRDHDFTQSALGRNHDFTRAQLDDWMKGNQFNREFNGALSMMPVNSAFQLNSMIQTYALDNPEVYTPNVISGMTNFFNQNFMQIIRDMFPGSGGYGGQAPMPTRRGP